MAYNLPCSDTNDAIDLLQKHIRVHIDNKTASVKTFICKGLSITFWQFYHCYGNISMVSSHSKL